MRRSEVETDGSGGRVGIQYSHSIVALSLNIVNSILNRIAYCCQIHYIQLKEGS